MPSEDNSVHVSKTIYSSALIFKCMSILQPFSFSCELWAFGHPVNQALASVVHVWDRITCLKTVLICLLPEWTVFVSSALLAGTLVS